MHLLPSRVLVQVLEMKIETGRKKRLTGGRKDGDLTENVGITGSGVFHED
jgi:hypothetical protein